MARPDHLFVSSSDGALYDCRAPGWSGKPPLRAPFKRHFLQIRTPAELKATLRAGPYAWPGGYPCYLLTSDGGSLCFACVRTELDSILPAVREQSSNGWNVVATCANYETPDLFCDHCGKQIEPAYGKEEE